MNSKVTQIEPVVVLYSNPNNNDEGRCKPSEMSCIHNHRKKLSVITLLFNFLIHFKQENLIHSFKHEHLFYLH